jgi:hypothetical protein
MEAKIRNGNLILVLPLEKPRLSATKKTLVVASSRGVRRTGCRIEGEILCVNVNAFIYPSGPENGKRQKHRGSKGKSSGTDRNTRERTEEDDE